MQESQPFRKGCKDPWYVAMVFSYVKIVATMLLSSNRDGMSVDFHLLAMSNRAAWSMLQTGFLCRNGIDSIFKRKRKNSGPKAHGVNWEIKPRTLSQKGMRRGQDQNICSRDPLYPQDLQQYGEAVG